MRIEVNGTAQEVRAQSLAALVDEMGFETDRVATALDGDFVPGAARAGTVLRPGCRVEILSPMQGG